MNHGRRSHTVKGALGHACDRVPEWGGCPPRVQVPEKVRKRRDPELRTDEGRALPGQDEVMAQTVRRGRPSLGTGTEHRWSKGRDAGVPEGPRHEWEVGVQGEHRWQRVLSPRDPEPLAAKRPDQYFG